jgi:hypothetical protein
MISIPISRCAGTARVSKNSMNFARSPGLIVYSLTSTIMRSVLTHDRAVQSPSPHTEDAADDQYEHRA